MVIPRTADPRWAEVVFARLKDQDTLQEVRRRLAKTQKEEKDHEGERERRPKQKAKAKAKGEERALSFQTMQHFPI